MLSTETARQYAQELENGFYEYHGAINSFFSSSIWDGESKDNICGKANNFYKEFKGDLINQVDCFSNAVSSYNNYNTAKKNQEAYEGRLLAASRNYDNAVQANDTANIEIYRQMVQEATSKCRYYSNDMKIFKNLTERLLSQVIDIKLAENEWVYYNQNNYGNYQYGYRNGAGTSPATIASGGCGPTSMAMIATYLLGEEHDPVEMANWSVNNGYRINGVGTAFSFFPAVSDYLGINCENKVATAENIYNALKEGKPVILSTSLTSAGHFVALKGLNEDGTVIMEDPNDERNNQRGWTIEEILRYTSNMWEFSVD